jgi:hypothetical protein
VQRLQEAASIPAEQHLAGGLRAQNLSPLRPHAAAQDVFQHLGHLQRRQHRSCGSHRTQPESPSLTTWLNIHTNRQGRRGAGPEAEKAGNKPEAIRQSRKLWHHSFSGGWAGYLLHGWAEKLRIEGRSDPQRQRSGQSPPGAAPGVPPPLPRYTIPLQSHPAGSRETAWVNPTRSVGRTVELG